VAALTLGGAVTAQAHEFKPAWGYAFIDDAPFNEPGGGALLPSTGVFPRGYIRDVAVDNRDVRMTVHVFTPGKANAEYSYLVNEGDFKNFPIDRRINIAPLEVSYLAYDFCRFNPANGVVEVCEARYRIGRPAAPTPTPTPTPTPDPGGGTTLPAPPPPADADGDGYVVGVDCSDVNNTVHPGAPEIPGNLIDDDCAGGDAPGRLSATIRGKWKTKNGRVWVDELGVLEAPEGARVDLTCRGARCPFKHRVAVVKADGTANLAKFFKRKFRPKITIDVAVTYPGWIGRVGRFAVKTADVPDMQRLCLPPGAAKPQRC
jgi:hypothetical protein